MVGCCGFVVIVVVVAVLLLLLFSCWSVVVAVAPVGDGAAAIYVHEEECVCNSLLYTFVGL